MEFRKILSIFSISFLLLPIFLFSQPQTFWPGNVIWGIWRLLGTIAAVVGAVILAYGIFKIATSGGDPKAVGEGKMLILWGGIGIVLGLAMTNWGATYRQIPTGLTTTVIVTWLAWFLGTIAAVVGAVILAYGIFKIATSGGDPKGVEEGKMLILWGGIGIVLGLAMMNIRWILGLFGITIPPLR